MHSNGQREGTVVSRGLGDRAWGRQTHNAQKNLARIETNVLIGRKSKVEWE